MKIGCAFANGIGNAIIFTSVIKALIYHFEEDIDLFIDSNWKSKGKESIELIFKNMPNVNLKKYPEEFNKNNYDNLYMSAHSEFALDIHKEFLGEEVDMNKLNSWASTFMSERDFYYLEIIKQFGYRGPIFPQFMPVDENFKLKEEGIRICIANGFQRSHYNTFKRKQYPHFVEVMKSIKKLYDDVQFYILGGIEDQEWSYQIVNEIDCIDYAGKLNILETASVVKQSDLIICNDSSVFHIADALGTKGVSLFGSTLCSKNKNLNDSIVILRSSLACSPCQRSVFFSMCAEPSNCMDSISPSLVVAAIRKLFNQIIKDKNNA